MTEPDDPRLLCGHSRARAYRIRHGSRIVLVCRTCRRWLTDRPKRRRSPDMPDFVTADRMRE